MSQETRVSHIWRGIDLLAVAVHGLTCDSKRLAALILRPTVCLMLKASPTVGAVASTPLHGWIATNPCRELILTVLGLVSARRR